MFLSFYFWHLLSIASDILMIHYPIDTSAFYGIILAPFPLSKNKTQRGYFIRHLYDCLCASTSQFTKSKQNYHYSIWQNNSLWLSVSSHRKQTQSLSYTLYSMCQTQKHGRPHFCVRHIKRVRVSFLQYLNGYLRRGWWCEHTLTTISCQIRPLGPALGIAQYICFALSVPLNLWLSKERGKQSSNHTHIFAKNNSYFFAKHKKM